MDDILGSNLPDYLGTFGKYVETGTDMPKGFSEVRLRPLGFFSMYVKELFLAGNGTRKLEGILYDAFGVAEFRGSIDLDNVYFIKSYTIDSIIKHNAPISPCVFIGRKAAKNTYVGEWYYIGKHSKAGSQYFELKQLNPPHDTISYN